MAEQELLYANAHLTGDFPNPDNAIGDTPGTWAGTVNTNSNYTSRWSMASPSAPLTENATQTVRVVARKGSNSGNPGITINIWVNGTVVSGLGTMVPITSTTSQTVTKTFNTSDIASDPSSVEVEVVQDAQGGNQNTRNSAQISHIEWEAAVTPLVAKEEDREVTSLGIVGHSQNSRVGQGARSTTSQGAMGSSTITTQGSVGRQSTSVGVGGHSALTVDRVGYWVAVSEANSGSSEVSRSTSGVRAISSEGTGGVSTITAAGSTGRMVISTGDVGASTAIRTAVGYRSSNSTGLSGHSTANGVAANFDSVTLTSEGLTGHSAITVIAIGHKALVSEGSGGTSWVNAHQTIPERDITVSLASGYSYIIEIGSPVSMLSIDNPDTASVELLEPLRYSLSASEPVNGQYTSQLVDSRWAIDLDNGRWVIADPVIDRS